MIGFVLLFNPLQYSCLGNLMYRGSRWAAVHGVARSQTRLTRLSSSSTQRRPLDYKTQHHPTTSSTLCKMPHLNNKRNKNTNSNISRQNYYLTQPCPSEEKQTNKQKLSTNLTLSKAYTNNWTNLRRAETKRKKEFNLELEKETSNTIN